MREIVLPISCSLACTFWGLCVSRNVALGWVRSARQPTWLGVAAPAYMGWPCYGLSGSLLVGRFLGTGCTSTIDILRGSSSLLLQLAQGGKKLYPLSLLVLPMLRQATWLPRLPACESLDPFSASLGTLHRGGALSLKATKVAADPNHEISQAQHKV